MNILIWPLIKFRRVLLFLACTSFAIISQASTMHLHKVADIGKTEISVNLPGKNKIHVVIWQKKLGKTYPYNAESLWGGDEGMPPKFVITSIKVTDDNEMIFIPLSAYSDFGNVKYINLEKTTIGFDLGIHGGDTATAYDAILKFKEGKIVSRTVRLREFPDDSWEKTTYSFVETD